MKINYKLQNVISVFIISALFLTISTSPVQAGSFWYTYLVQEAQRFDAAGSDEARYAMISKPLNLTYLTGEATKGTHPSELDSKKLNHLGDGRLSVDEQDNVFGRKTNLLALAISTGQLDFLRKFLKWVNDINAPELLVSSEEQHSVNLAHISVDFIYPYVSTVTQEVRLQIIDAIAVAGIDFNYVQPQGWHQHAPLIAPMVHGNYNDVKDRHVYQARILLHGADLKKNIKDDSGSFRPYVREGSELRKSLHDQYEDMHIKGDFISPSDDTMELIDDEREHRYSR